MREMVRERIVEQMPIMPNIRDVGAFEDGFLRFLAEQPRDALDDKHVWHPVHVEKLGYGRLAETLLRQRLAVEFEGEGYGNWLLVEPRTAQEFMAYLASCMAANTQRGRSLIAMTDDPENLEVFSNRERLKNELLFRTVDGLLPSPAEDVDLRDIVNFRERHKKDLRELRKNVEFRLKRALVHGEEAGDQLFDLELEDLKERSRRLSVAMEKPRWGVPRLGSLSGISSMLALGGAGAAVEPTLEAIAAQPAAAISLAAAAFAFAASCRLSVEPSPLAYASMAQSQFQR